MNKVAAREIAIEALRERRDLPHQVLAERAAANIVETFEVETESGVVYQVEIQYLYDDGVNVRVWANVDDGGLRAFMPLTECFIKAPDGGFIDE